MSSLSLSPKLLTLLVELLPSCFANANWLVLLVSSLKNSNLNEKCMQNPTAKRNKTVTNRETNVVLRWNHFLAPGLESSFDLQKLDVEQVANKFRAPGGQKST